MAPSDLFVRRICFHRPAAEVVIAGVNKPSVRRRPKFRSRLHFLNRASSLSCQLVSTALGGLFPCLAASQWLWSRPGVKKQIPINNLQDCLMRRVESVLILEDDAIPLPNFSDEIEIS